MSAYLVEIYDGYSAASRVIARMYAADETERRRLMNDPLFSCFHRRSIRFDDRVFARQKCEEAGYERATPGRVNAVKAVLSNSAEPLTEQEVRRRAESRGPSFGHGNQIIRILERHAVKATGSEADSKHDTWAMPDEETDDRSH